MGKFRAWHASVFPPSRRICHNCQGPQHLPTVRVKFHSETVRGPVALANRNLSRYFGRFVRWRFFGGMGNTWWGVQGGFILYAGVKCNYIQTKLWSQHHPHLFLSFPKGGATYAHLYTCTHAHGRKTFLWAVDVCDRPLNNSPPPWVQSGEKWSEVKMFFRWSFFAIFQLKLMPGIEHISQPFVCPRYWLPQRGKPCGTGTGGGGFGKNDGEQRDLSDFCVNSDSPPHPKSPPPRVFSWKNIYLGILSSRRCDFFLLAGLENQPSFLWGIFFAKKDSQDRQENTKMQSFLQWKSILAQLHFKAYHHWLT